MKEDFNPLLRVYTWTLVICSCIAAVGLPLILHETLGTIVAIVISIVVFLILLSIWIITVIDSHKRKSMGEL